MKNHLLSDRFRLTAFIKSGRHHSCGEVSPALLLGFTSFIFLVFIAVALALLHKSQRAALAPLPTPTRFALQPITTPVDSSRASLPSSSPFQARPQAVASQTPPASPFSKQHSGTSIGSSQVVAPTTSHSIDALKARELVERWLHYKSLILAPPYDVSRLSDYVVTLGPLYSDFISPGGTIDWLMSNAAYYRFVDQKIVEVKGFSLYSDRAHLILRIRESLEVRTPSGLLASKSGIFENTWDFELKLDSGRWLIYETRKVN